MYVVGVGGSADNNEKIAGMSAQSEVTRDGDKNTASGHGRLKVTRNETSQLIYLALSTVSI